MLIHQVIVVRGDPVETHRTHGRRTGQEELVFAGIQKPRHLQLRPGDSALFREQGDDKPIVIEFGLLDIPQIDVSGVMTLGTP